MSNSIRTTTTLETHVCTATKGIDSHVGGSVSESFLCKIGIVQKIWILLKRKSTPYRGQSSGAGQAWTHPPLWYKIRIFRQQKRGKQEDNSRNNEVVWWSAQGVPLCVWDNENNLIQRQATCSHISKTKRDKRRVKHAGRAFFICIRGGGHCCANAARK